MPQPPLSPYSPDPSLTIPQHHVLALLAEGHSLAHAAAKTGIHRNTIRNWRRTVPAFARELSYAAQEQALAWHDHATDLAPRAAEVLDKVLNDPDTAPALRLRAALAVLKTVSTAPISPGVVQNTGSESDAQSCTTQPPLTIRKQPEPARNSLCPCGSGLKFKRCCANAAPPPPKTANP